jgi:DNA-binding transcriptional MerR regulator
MATTSELTPIGSQDGHLLRVGDLARATGKTVRAIHLYEELGLLRPATRSSGGFRLYEPGAIERVHWIDSLHALGFSLQEMREVLRSWWSAGQGDEAMADLRELFTRKLAETRESIRLHQQLERELEDGLRYLETCTCCAAPGPVRGCVTCQQDHGVAEPPALVAGIRTPADAARAPLVRVRDPREATKLRRTTAR